MYKTDIYVIKPRHRSTPIEDEPEWWSSLQPSQQAQLKSIRKGVAVFDTTDGVLFAAATSNQLEDQAIEWWWVPTVEPASPERSFPNGGLLLAREEQASVSEIQQNVPSDFVTRPTSSRPSVMNSEWSRWFKGAGLFIQFFILFLLGLSILKVQKTNETLNQTSVALNQANTALTNFINTNDKKFDDITNKIGKLESTAIQLATTLGEVKQFEEKTFGLVNKAGENTRAIPDRLTALESAENQNRISLIRVESTLSMINDNVTILVKKNPTTPRR